MIDTSEIRTVKADTEDIEAILHFNEELINQYENIAEIDYKRIMDWVKRKIENFIDDYRVIKYENKKVGYYYFYKTKRKMELDDLFVFPEYRDQGIGSFILEKCINETHLPIFLYVFSKNTKAISLYEKHGFVITEALNETRCIMQRESLNSKNGSRFSNLFGKR